MAKDMQAIINAAVAAALAQAGTTPIAATTAPASAPKTNGETKEAREARKLAVAKGLPETFDVNGTKVPLTFTSSRKGKEFTFHTVVNGVKARVNGYVMPE